MDIDMEVAWCLTCSKWTRDPRNPYCSDACRQADTQPPRWSAMPVPFTSFVPPLMTSQRIAPVMSTSPVKKSAKGPSVTPLAPLPRSSEFGSSPSGPLTLPRDRRAFSFPAVQYPAPQPVMTKNRKTRQSSDILPPFARKPCLTATFLTSPVSRVDFLSLTGPPPLALGLATTAAAHTPLFPDSVFCSSWESSNDEPGKSPVKTLVPLPGARGASTSTIIHAATLPDDCRFLTLRSQLPSARPNTLLRTSEASHSPIAAMIASSASSWSREDIISWAKAVGMRPDASSSGLKDQPRGRSRTRRRLTLGRLTLAQLYPPSTELLEVREGNDSTGPRTTPKGRIRSEPAGLSMGGIVAIIQALTSVTKTTSPANPNTSSPSPPQLRLQSVPAPAEISRFAVVATTSPGEDTHEDTHDATPAHSFSDATPTLSTISFPEVVDPSVGDNHHRLDIVMDGQSAVLTGFSGRPSMSLKPRQPSYSSTVPAPVLEPRRRNRLPLRPIATTATSTPMWNLSACLHSFAPFSTGSAVAPKTPFASVDPPDPAFDSSTPSSIGYPPAPPAAPMPALRAGSPSQVAAPPVQDIFRTRPMDISPPHNGAGAEERRPHSISITRNRSREKGIAPSRSPNPMRNRSASRSLSRSPGSISRSRNSSAGIQLTPVHLHERKWSSDAQVCEDDGEPRRGRSGVGKALGSSKDRSMSAYRDEGEPRRAWERARPGAPGQEWGSACMGRGRDPTVRVI